MSITDRALAEAERQWSRDTSDGHPLSAHARMDRRVGFVLGALWGTDQKQADAELCNIIYGEDNQ